MSAPEQGPPGASVLLRILFWSVYAAVAMYGALVLKGALPLPF